MENRPDKDAFYENVTRPQIVRVIALTKMELSYEVTQPTTNNPKTTFICSIERFNNLYEKR